MAGIKRVCCMLLCVAVAAATDEQLRVDELFELKAQETQRELAGVEQQLSRAMQMEKLFKLEKKQMELFSEETRAKFTIIQAEVKKEIEDVVLEVGNVRRAALENVTAWMKSLRELQEATERNKQTLQSIREQKELEEQQRQAAKELELELQEREKQREKEIELERQAEEVKKMQERERLRELEEQRALEQLQAEKEKKELEEQRVLEQLQALEKEKREMEEQQKQHEIELQALEKETERQKKVQQDLEEQKEREVQEKKSDAQAEEEKESNNQAEETLLSDSSERTSSVKTVLNWYVSMEQTLLDAVAAVYRQLVLPVVIILAFFLLLTVAIAKYNSMKQDQRNRRVLYSGYPASYRRKMKQQEKPATADGPSLRPRLHHSLPHRDPNGFLGN